MKKWVLPLTLACFLLGCLLVVQIRLQDSAKEDIPNQTEVLVTLINNLESEIATKENNLISLRQQIEEMSSTLNTDVDELNELQQEISTARLLAGATPLNGYGLVITFDDNHTISTNNDANTQIIHYQDLLYIVNELRRSGAEAISINDQRLIASSEIRCVGNTILVNTTRLAPPYEIKALGNPQLLLEGVQSSDTYTKLYAAGFPIQYQIYDEFSETLLEIPTYSSTYPVNLTTIAENEE